MAQQSKNSVESVHARVPPPPPSPSSSSSSSSSSSKPKPAAKCCVNASDFYSTHVLNLNESNFKRSAAPARIMSYRNGSWLDFSGEVIDSVKSSFSEGKPIAKAKIGASMYLFDFLRMVQTDFDTGKQRSIAWIDVNGKCFFPKVFLDDENEDDNSTKIEVDVNVNKRQKEAVDQDDDASAKRQRLVVANSVNAKWLNSRLLSGTEKTYAVIRDYFLSGIRKIDAGATITSIHQWTHAGHLERARFDVFQKQVEITNAARGSANTVFAWYGASAKVVDSILGYGFGAPNKISTHGVGIYLSPVGFPWSSAQIAEADENGEKHLILCSVILGNVEKVEAGSQQCYPSSVDFDTGSDDPKIPKWYVVWPNNMNRHILPHCVVSYKPSFPVRAKLSKGRIEQLFSKWKNALPPAKLQEVINLFYTYKAGKLAKDDFFKQVRVIAGDEMMKSTFREIGPSE